MVGEAGALPGTPPTPKIDRRGVRTELAEGLTRRVVFYTSDEDYAAYVEEAKYTAQASLSSWLRHTLRTTVRQHQSRRENRGLEREKERARQGRGSFASGWPRDLPCPLCDRTHDPIPAHSLIANPTMGNDALMWLRTAGDGGKQYKRAQWDRIERSVAAGVGQDFASYENDCRAALERAEAALEGDKEHAGPVPMPPTPSSDPLPALGAFLEGESACTRCMSVPCTCTGGQAGPDSSVPLPTCTVCGRFWVEHSEEDRVHCVEVEAGV